MTLNLAGFVWKTGTQGHLIYPCAGDTLGYVFKAEAALITPNPLYMDIWRYR